MYALRTTYDRGRYLFEGIVDELALKEKPSVWKKHDTHRIFQLLSHSATYLASANKLSVCGRDRFGTGIFTLDLSDKSWTRIPLQKSYDENDFSNCKLMTINKDEILVLYQDRKSKFGISVLRAAQMKTTPERIDLGLMSGEYPGFPAKFSCDVIAAKEGGTAFIPLTFQSQGNRPIMGLYKFVWNGSNLSVKLCGGFMQNVESCGVSSVFGSDEDGALLLQAGTQDTVVRGGFLRGRDETASVVQLKVQSMEEVNQEWESLQNFSFMRTSDDGVRQLYISRAKSQAMVTFLKIDLSLPDAKRIPIRNPAPQGPVPGTAPWGNSNILDDQASDSPSSTSGTASSQNFSDLDTAPYVTAMGSPMVKVLLDRVESLEAKVAEIERKMHALEQATMAKVDEFTATITASVAELATKVNGVVFDMSNMQQQREAQTVEMATRTLNAVKGALEKNTKYIMESVLTSNAKADHLENSVQGHSKIINDLRAVIAAQQQQINTLLKLGEDAATPPTATSATLDKTNYHGTGVTQSENRGSTPLIRQPFVFDPKPKVQVLTGDGASYHKPDQQQPQQPWKIENVLNIGGSASTKLVPDPAHSIPVDTFFSGQPPPIFGPSPDYVPYQQTNPSSGTASSQNFSDLDPTPPYVTAMGSPKKVDAPANTPSKPDSSAKEQNEQNGENVFFGLPKD
eukprot:TRINITY_DN8058_c0_g1_i1.p1 TRINITY_DN8058_c0_g1~~TRINITY_DN8058_c0_g1_i1.p1  ORF type:complete len:683 (+),score=99.85 TRINITY_DN8058_c0_g1_i1:1-2049(+)